jgi:hypothetical protein
MNGPLVEGRSGNFAPALMLRKPRAEVFFGCEMM